MQKKVQRILVVVSKRFVDSRAPGREGRAVTERPCRRGIILILGALVAFTPLRSDAATDDLLDQGYNDMYSLKFDEAHRCFQQWEHSHPTDPTGPVSDAAAYLFSEFNRLRILQSEFFV